MVITIILGKAWCVVLTELFWLGVFCLSRLNLGKSQLKKLGITLSAYGNKTTNRLYNLNFCCKMSTKLVLIRHGESAWNNENRFTGWYDADLSNSGLKEALDAGQVKY